MILAIKKFWGLCFVWKLHPAWYRDFKAKAHTGIVFPVNCLSLKGVTLLFHETLSQSIVIIFINVVIIIIFIVFIIIIIL